MAASAFEAEYATRFPAIVGLDIDYLGSMNRENRTRRQLAGSGGSGGGGGAKAREDRVADHLRDLRDYGVSEGASSVHPVGNPIIHSTSSGFGRIPSCGCPRIVSVRQPEPKGLPKVQFVYPRDFRGVGNNPHTRAIVGGAKESRRYDFPFNIEPASGQRSEYVSQPSIKQLCAVFQEDEAGSKDASKAVDLPEEARALAMQTCARTCWADVLARKTACDDIGGSDLLAGKFPHVSVAGDIGPVLGEDATGELFDFAEGDGLETARAFEAKAEPSDAREKIEDAQLIHLSHPPIMPVVSRDKHRHRPAADARDQIMSGVAQQDGGKAVTAAHQAACCGGVKSRMLFGISSACASALHGHNATTARTSGQCGSFSMPVSFAYLRSISLWRTAHRSAVSKSGAA